MINFVINPISMLKIFMVKSGYKANNVQSMVNFIFLKRPGPKKLKYTKIILKFTKPELV